MCPSNLCPWMRYTQYTSTLALGPLAVFSADIHFCVSVLEKFSRRKAEKLLL